MPYSTFKRFYENSCGVEVTVRDLTQSLDGDKVNLFLLQDLFEQANIIDEQSLILLSFDNIKRLRETW